MASGFSSAPNLPAALALSFILLANIAHTSSPSPALPPSPAPPPPLPGRDGDDDYSVTESEKELGYLLLIFIAPLYVLIVLTLACLICPPNSTRDGPKRTLLQVQVVLSARAGDVGSVLRDVFAKINRPEPVAESKKTILKETIKALLGHQNSYIYGSTSVTVKPVDKISTFAMAGMVRKELKKLRIQREYLHNFRSVPKLAQKQDKDYTVVMMMVLADGVHKLPLVGSSMDVKEALNYLETKVPSILDVEIMWAYQDPLLIVELLDIYPNLDSILA